MQKSTQTYLNPLKFNEFIAFSHSCHLTADFSVTLFGKILYLYYLESQYMVSLSFSRCDRLHTAFSHICVFFFFFFLRVNSNLTWVYCSCTVWYCLCIKNIKNGSHDTIYTFKNYFATVFLVFNFQFSATINSIQTDPLNISHVKKKKT